MAIKSNLNSDFGYYNILINNNSDTDKEALFNETRTTPILTNVQDFYLTVIRFKIPTNRIPLFIFEEDENGNSPYFITFSLGKGYNNPVSVRVDFSSTDANEDIGAQRPRPKAIYYYSSFTNMVNQAFRDLYGQILTNPAYATAFTNAGINPVTELPANSPQIRYNPETTLFSLQVPYVTGTEQGSPFTQPTVINQDFINIHFSKKLNFFYQGFNDKILINPPTPNAQVVLNFPKPTLVNGGNLGTEPAYNLTTPARNYLEITQDYSTVNLWQTLTRIILGTTVPIEQEYIGVEGRDGTNFNQLLLTDFEIEPNENGRQRDYIYYNADHPRYSNFSSNGDLNFFDLRVFYQTKDLSTYPVLIAPNDEISVKLQFKRRPAKTELQYSSANAIVSTGTGRLTGFNNYR